MVGGEFLWVLSFVSHHHNVFQVNSSCYHPAWVSLARDYLSIMSSSVSSERAFSQGGITITKLRNRLKGDIVEALQCIKCAIRHDLLFREPAPSSVVEAEFNSDADNRDDHSGNDGGGSESAEGWDEKFLDGKEDDIEMDIELDSD
jgi:hAT family C-terminal dimerisation region